MNANAAIPTKDWAETDYDIVTLHEEGGTWVGRDVEITLVRVGVSTWKVDDSEQGHNIRRGRFHPHVFTVLLNRLKEAGFFEIRESPGDRAFDASRITISVVGSTGSRTYRAQLLSELVQSEEGGRDAYRFRQSYRTIRQFAEILTWSAPEALDASVRLPEDDPSFTDTEEEPEGEYHASCAVCGCAVYESDGEPFLTPTCAHLVGGYYPPHSFSFEDLPGLTESFETLHGLEHWGVPIRDVIIAIQQDSVTVGLTAIPPSVNQLWNDQPPSWVTDLFELVPPLGVLEVVIEEAIVSLSAIKTSSGGENWGMGSGSVTYLWSENPEDAWSRLSAVLDDRVSVLSTVARLLGGQPKPA
jgi:hypothetical protein